MLVLMRETFIANLPLALVGIGGFAWVVRALYHVEKALMLSVHVLDTRLTAVEIRLQSYRHTLIEE